MARAGKVMTEGHRQGSVVRGCLSGVLKANCMVDSEVPECRRIRKLFKHPVGKPSEAELPKELPHSRLTLLISLRRGPLLFIYFFVRTTAVPVTWLLAYVSHVAVIR